MSPAEMAAADTEPPPAEDVIERPLSERARIRSREMLLAGKLELAGALLELSEQYAENERLRRELANARTEERAECIVLVERLAEEFRRGCESDWEYGAIQAASELRGKRR